MAKGKSFDLGQFLSQNVSIPDTFNREQIEYIDLDLLNGDEKNFYSIEGLEELAANIALIGLQQPVRARPDEEDAGAFKIVSGHRRTAALRQLKKDDPEKYAQIPCIIERDEASSAMRELRLIYANSDTRVMSSAEMAYQAERVAEIFEQLKAEGVEFHGRIRDHVAKVCNVSATKLARLKVIRSRLIQEFSPSWEKGELSEASAYRLAQEENKIQRAVLWSRGLQHICALSEQELNNVLEAAKAPPPKTEPIDFKSLDSMIQGKNSEFSADGYLEELRLENLKFLDSMRERYADLLIAEMPVTPQSRTDSIQALKQQFSNRGFTSTAVNYTGSGKGLRIETPDGSLITRSWVEVWDALALTALERMRAAAYQQCRDDAPAVTEWRPLSILNEPKEGQRVLLAGLCDGEPVYSERKWRQLNAFEQEVYKFWAAINEPEWEG